MNVLVTGGAGYIGNVVVAQLLQKGHYPTVFDSFYWGKESILPFEDKIQLIEGDIRNPREIKQALTDIDAVIHLAGIVGESACNINHKAHLAVNIEANNTILKCCTNIYKNRDLDFIFASSCSVYGNQGKKVNAIDENGKTNPLSTYAIAKLISEKIIIEHSKKNLNIHPSILRVSTVFGWSNRPRLDLVTNRFTYQAWKGDQVTIYGDGNQYRSLVHVQDVAKAFIDVLEAPNEKKKNHFFNVSNIKNNFTIREIAETVAELIPNTDIVYRSEIDTDRRNFRINSNKIQQVLGWKAEWDVKTGVLDLIDHLNRDSNWENYKYRNDKYDYI